MKINFNSFAEQWEDGMPFGNGRLAAMQWGRKNDIFSLNHEWIWTGNFKNRENEKGAAFLPIVRDYLDKKDFFRANAIAAVAFGGNGGISPLERQMDSYQPAGELTLSIKNTPMAITRTIDLEHGIVTSTKVYADNTITTTSWCDTKANVICIQINSDKSLNFRIKYEREQQEGTNTKIAYCKTGFRFDCDMNTGVSFAVKANIFTDGCTKSNNGISVINASNINIAINIGTQHDGIEKELSKYKLDDISFDTALAGHSILFAKKINASSIEINDGHTAPHFIDEAVQQYKDDKTQSAYLVCAYGRLAQYLMVSGSICGTLPLNLQGKWNRSTTPKWNSDYHLNINLQMNYWFAHQMGLHDYCKQMLDYVLSLLPKARKAAQDLYGCKGIWYPLSTDIWTNCTAEAYNYAVWIGASGWLCRHFLEYYSYTQDTEMLKNTIYPFVREAVQFYEDYFTFDDKGMIKIQPSQSPENKFEGGGYFPVAICTNAAMDVQIIYETLQTAIYCANTLNVDEQDQSRWENLLMHFPPFGIGSDGRLLEWDSEEKKELELGHRHVSHLYGVYPAQLFTPSLRVPQYEAAKRSLRFRMEHSGGYTGWSCAWAACLYARFLEGENLQACLQQLICKLSSKSLLDLHPNFNPLSDKKKRSDNPVLFERPAKNPSMIFQIDGNLGAAAAINEALVQVREGVIYLLCAVPKVWKSGKISNMALPGGHTISFTFADNKITQLSIVIGDAKAATFYGVKQMEKNNKLLTITGNKGDLITII